MPEKPPDTSWPKKVRATLSPLIRAISNSVNSVANFVLLNLYHFFTWSFYTWDVKIYPNRKKIAWWASLALILGFLAFSTYRLASEWIRWDRQYHEEHIQSEMAVYRAIKEKNTDLFSCRERYPLLVRGAFPDDNGYLTECHNIDIRREQYYRQMRRRISTYCQGTRNPKVCDQIGKEGVEIERAIGFDGMAKWFVAVARNEQNYNCPDFNCWGWGSPSSDTWIKFKSYRDGIVTIINSLYKRGYRGFDDRTIVQIGTWYAGADGWGHRILNIYKSI